MYLCEKNFCCCGWQYYDSERDICDEAKKCGHLIEVAPVVHGEWIHTGKTNVYGGHQHECSVCGYTLMVSPMCDNENFCCNYGAKMDLK